MRIIKSQTPDLELPRLDVLSLLFDWGPAKEETQIHVEAANEKNFVTKAEARDLTKRIAYVLRHEYGIGASGPGKDTVLTTSSGNPFVPCIFYSVLAAGGIFSGASTAYRTNELVRQAKDAASTLFVCSAEYEIRNVEAAKQCGVPLDRVLVLDCAVPRQWRLLSVKDRSDVLQRGRGRMLNWKRITDQKELEETTCCLLYSSGTTGLPKGVRLSQWNLSSSNPCTMAVATKYMEQCKRNGRDFSFSTIAHLPMAHIAGLDMYSMNPFFMGGTTYWMKGFDFDTFIECHQKYRPSFQFSVPPIWLQVAKSSKVTDHFDHIEIAQTGAAPMGPELAEQVTRRLGRGKVRLVQTYGTTETAGSICAMDWTMIDESFSVGDVCPNNALRFLDENDKDVEPGMPGEVLVGGPIVCQGYHNRPEANADSFFEGYYRTGDIGIYRDGKVWIVDRKKELIKYKGLQVAPAELEAHLVSHPKIVDAAVIGVVDNEQGTELPRAYVVVRPQERMSGQEVADFVKQNLSTHKQLRGGVVFVSEVPKSASGKILRKDLRLRASQELMAKL